MRYEISILSLIMIAGAILPCRTGAQVNDSIYINLYTDSLKRGSFNYINIDGRTSDGRFTPLDTSQLEFSASAGSFFGNSLYLPVPFSGETVDITAILKRNRTVTLRITMPVKKTDDNGTLPGEEEFYRNSGKKKRSPRRSG